MKSTHRALDYRSSSFTHCFLLHFASRVIKEGSCPRLCWWLLHLFYSPINTMRDRTVHDKTKFEAKSTTNHYYGALESSSHQHSLAPTTPLYKSSHPPHHNTLRQYPSYAPSVCERLCFIYEERPQEGETSGVVTENNLVSPVLGRK
jgi:hypothetical protein